MNERIINEIIQSICMDVKIHGSCGQLFDSDFPEEYRTVIAYQLIEKNITRVRISKYADVYFPSDLDECEKSELIYGYRANYQAALNEIEMPQEIKTAISKFLLGAILAEIFGFPNNDDEVSDE